MPIIKSWGHILKVDKNTWSNTFFKKILHSFIFTIELNMYLYLNHLKLGFNFVYISVVLSYNYQLHKLSLKVNFTWIWRKDNRYLL